MDEYKLKTSDARGKPISKDRFEEETLCRYPWYRPSSDGKTSQFAVCQGCDNPIQLIGLYRLPANAQHPFGKHTTQSIKDLAELDPEERDNCGYFKPRQHNKSDRRSRFDGIPRKIVTLLIEQFDRVVYLLEKQIGVRFSRAALQKMLRRYRGEQVWSELAQSQVRLSAQGRPAASPFFLLFRVACPSQKRKEGVYEAESFL